MCWAVIAGNSHRLLSEHGFDVINYDHDEGDHEAQTSREIALYLSH